MNPTPEQLAEIDALLAKGNKIAAIKRYRAVAKCDLKDAKEWVEAHAETLPNAHIRHTGKGGCVPVLGVLIFAGIIAAAAVCRFGP